MSHFVATLAGMLALGSGCGVPIETIIDHAAGGSNGGPVGGAAGTAPPEAGVCGSDDVVSGSSPGVDLISDFEDGSGSLREVNGRSGGWFTFSDSSPNAQITPTVGITPVTADPIPEGARCWMGNSEFALRVRGRGFNDWGAGFGTDLRQIPAAPGTMDVPRRGSIDASAYRGIAFWVRRGDSPGATLSSIRVNLPDVQTDPDGGICSPSAGPGPDFCHDDFGASVPVTTEWRKVVLPFSSLKQSGFGATFEGVRADALFAIHVLFPAGAVFDVWFDDVHFVK